jgi:hypothetical protein
LITKDRPLEESGTKPRLGTAVGRRPRKLIGKANGKHDRLPRRDLTKQSEGVVENKGPAPKTNRKQSEERPEAKETRPLAVSSRQKAEGGRPEKLMAKKPRPFLKTKPRDLIDNKGRAIGGIRRTHGWGQSEEGFSVLRSSVYSLRLRN